MRSLLAVRRELARVKRELDGARSQHDRDEQFGAMQALSWVLRENAVAPSALAPKIGK